MAGIAFDSGVFGLVIIVEFSDICYRLFYVFKYF